MTWSRTKPQGFLSSAVTMVNLSNHILKSLLCLSFAVTWMKTSIREQFNKHWARSGSWIWWLIYRIILEKSAFLTDHRAVVASKHVGSVRDTCSRIWAVDKTAVKVIHDINGHEIQIKTFLLFRLIHSSSPPLLCRLPHPDHQEAGGQDHPGATLGRAVLWLQTFPKAREVVQGPGAPWALGEVQNQEGSVLSRAQDHEGEAWGRWCVQVQGWDRRDRSHAERWRYERFAAAGLACAGFYDSLFHSGLLLLRRGRSPQLSSNFI